MERLRSLQVLRGMAAAAVTLVHIAVESGGPPHVGHIGVDIFFVLSGFIITQTALAKPERFFRQRLVRVLPLYYVFLAPVLWAFYQSGDLEMTGLMASLTLWPAWGEWTQPYLTVGWTLSFEMLFYAAVALLLAGVRLWALLAAYALCWAVSWSGSIGFGFLGAPIILEFLAGVGIALMARSTAPVAAAALAISCAAIAFFVATGSHGIEALPVAGPAGLWRVLAWGIPAALLVYGALAFEDIFRHPIFLPLVFLGDASYSLYLSHLLTINLLRDAPLGAATLLAACIAVSAVVYLGIERPLLALMRMHPLLGKPPRPITV